MAFVGPIEYPPFGVVQYAQGRGRYINREVADLVLSISHEDGQNCGDGLFPTSSTLW